MADIYPFRGVSYSAERIGSYDQVATQPYDKITPQMKESYLKKSPYNFAQIILPGAGDRDTDEKYTAAAETLRSWMAEGLISRSETACFYPYHQTYRVPGTGEIFTRRGFVGLGKLSEYSEGVILPHEHTHSGPKVDRLKLTRATGCQFGQLFMLYSDPKGSINELLDSAIENVAPFIELEDEDGITHRMWRVEVPEVLGAVQRAMKDRTLYIADGHHRYETARIYWHEREAAGVKPVGNEAADRAMMTFVSLQDKGLSVLPTHRVLFNLSDFTMSALKESLSGEFEVAEVGSAKEGDLLEALNQIAGQKWHFLLAAKGEHALLMIRLKEGMFPADCLEGDGSEVWKSLDVNVLHKLILERRLKISPEDLEHQRCVAYLRDPAEALRMVLDPGSKYQAVFFLNPTSVEQVTSVAERGECMPQKSTDFYPKMLSGLVFNQINQ
jgi:uncharacterized protein (DUF1015 family)